MIQGQCQDSMLSWYIIQGQGQGSISYPDTLYPDTLLGILQGQQTASDCEFINMLIL